MHLLYFLQMIFKSINPVYRFRQIRRLCGRPLTRFYLVNEFLEVRKCVDEVLEYVVAELRNRDIAAYPVKLSKVISQPFSSRDLILTHQPIVKQGYVGNTLCLGMPSMNRRQRLDFLEREKFPVMPWANPKNKAELLDLFESWQVDHLLLKQDQSLGARGIRLIEKGKLDGLKWCESDVFCPILSEDATTYKVHFLGSVVLCAFTMATPPILDRKRMDLMGPNSPEDYKKFAITPQLATEIGRVGSALVRFGGGYSSIDLMISRGQFVAIELNTNSIGTTLPWSLFGGEIKVNLVPALQEIYEGRHMFRIKSGQRFEAVNYFAGKRTPISLKERVVTFRNDFVGTFKGALK